jgi:EamA domain-containing membrane protein RarD
VPIAIAFLGEKISSRETVGIVIALVSVVALAWEKPPVPDLGGDEKAG